MKAGSSPLPHGGKKNQMEGKTRMETASISKESFVDLHLRILGILAVDLVLYFPVPLFLIPRLRLTEVGTGIRRIKFYYLLPLYGLVTKGTKSIA